VIGASPHGRVLTHKSRLARHSEQSEESLFLFD